MYEKIFDADNPFWRGMGRIFDAFVLNVLWLLCCIPLVTIGPSTVAFYSTMITLVRGEETYVSRDFFQAFRHNLRRNLVAGVLLTLLGAFLAMDVYIAHKSGLGIYTFLMVFFAVFFLLWAFVTLYAWPLLAKLDSGLKEIFILAFTMSIRNLPQTLMMLFVTVLAMWVTHLLPGLVFLVFGLMCEFHSTLFAVLLKPWLPPLEHEVEEEEEDEEDGWGEEL